MENTPAGPGLVAPVSYSPRDFRKTARMNGNISNPPAFSDVGGLSGPSKIDNDAFNVEKPTSRNPAVRKATKI